jgi:hypothetical protein
MSKKIKSAAPPPDEESEEEEELEEEEPGDDDDGDEDDEDEDEDDDENFMDTSDILVSLLSTEEGDNVCTALVKIGNQLEIQNKIMVKILSALNNFKT